MNARRLARLLVGILGLGPSLGAQAAFFPTDSLLPQVSPSFFGRSVALQDEQALVGGGGMALFFEETAGGWAETGAFQSPLSDACGFGLAVGLEGAHAAAGDPLRRFLGFCDGPGSLTTYADGGPAWSQGVSFNGGNIQPPAGNGLIAYGRSIVIRGDTMLVGADGSSTKPTSCGFPAVVDHRFDGSGWVVQESFAAADSAACSNQEFGYAVALSHDGLTAVVGAPGLEAAYVFSHVGGQWVETRKLEASDGQSGDRFGHSVAIEDDLVVVGAANDDSPLVDAGSVYVFREVLGNWSEVGNFAAGLPQEDASFGYRMALEDGVLAVSARNAVSLYRRRGEQLHPLQVLQSEEGYDLHEASVALDSKRCLVGAPWSNVTGLDWGGAFLFDVEDLALTTNGSSVAPGGEVQLTTRGGLPGATCWISVTLRGLGALPQLSPPTVILPNPGLFGAESQARTRLKVPAGLSGATLSFQSSGFHQPGLAGTSNVRVVRVP